MRKRQRHVDRHMGHRFGRANGSEDPVFGFAAVAYPHFIGCCERPGTWKSVVRVEHVNRGTRYARQLSCGAQQHRRLRSVCSAVVQPEACKIRRLGVQNSRDVNALAVILKETFDGMRQVAVRIAIVVEIVEPQTFSEPASILSVAGNQDRNVQRPALGDTNHAGRAGTDTLDRFITGVDLFNVDSGG